mmetsp:Transcript_40692/g.97608  ORF Transcript_40692/g.97608 Transcript_40692/m.97608 type:complete len:252 (-) Transcript_40692:25-780(-)
MITMSRRDIGCSLDTGLWEYPSRTPWVCSNINRAFLHHRLVDVVASERVLFGDIPPKFWMYPICWVKASWMLCMPWCTASVRFSKIFVLCRNCMMRSADKYPSSSPAPYICSSLETSLASGNPTRRKDHPVDDTVSFHRAQATVVAPSGRDAVGAISRSPALVTNNEASTTLSLCSTSLCTAGFAQNLAPTSLAAAAWESAENPYWSPTFCTWRSPQTTAKTAALTRIKSKTGEFTGGNEGCLHPGKITGG